jgi:hypothetical protein
MLTGRGLACIADPDITGWYASVKPASRSDAFTYSDSSGRIIDDKDILLAMLFSW